LEGVVESAPAFWDGVNCEGEKASIWLENIMADAFAVCSFASPSPGWNWIGERYVVPGEYEEEEWREVGQSAGNARSLPASSFGVP
jgi:hypothetical protein